VTNTYSNNVSIIDTGTNTVIKSKNVGKYPQAFGRFTAPSTFTITPSKIRISDNVQCNASQIVDLSKDRIFWDFGDGTTDDSGNPVVNHSYSKLGSYKVTLTVEDSTGNVYTTSRFVHVTIPVVLVHGWRSSPVVWNNMTNRLQQEGFEVWNFDYERFNTFDPLVIAPNLSDFIDTQRNNLTYNGQEYNGPIDIVCHSMGAIVSRYYMEDLNGGIHGKDVRQWIGIAPAHHGSAGADLFASIPVFSSNILLKNLKLVFLGRAVNELTTYSFAVESLGPLSPTTKYRVIAGWNPNHSKDFGVGPLSATVAKRISGSGFPYYWTYSGDMIVATAQSYDPAMGFDAFPIGGILGNLPAHEFDHVHIHSSPTVIETVTRYLKDINKSSSNVLPPDDEIPFGNLSLSQKVISGLLNNDVQHVPIIFENIVPFANSSDLNHIESNAGSKLQLNSISMTTHQGTASSPENALVTLLDWDDGDINMTLTSPSGIEYSANSHPNNTWYTKDGNSLNYIITNPESGNWTVNLTPTNYPGHDIHYNLTYVVQTINASESGVLPIANFTSNVTEGFVPLSVNFTDLSTYATSLYWDFGDGNNSIGSTPTHTYTTVGNYMVNLTAINKNGTNSTFAKINVLEQPEKPILPIANFSSNVTSGYAPLTVQFTDLSGNATGWNWSFGNRAKSSQQNSTYTYFLIGNYTVNLTVSNENGTDSKIATIMVKQPEGTTPYAYITNSGSSNISVIDTTTDTVKATINVSSSPEGIAVNSAGTKVYVANGGNNTVSVIDTASNAVTADISVGQGPRGVAVTPDGTKVYVTNAVDNDVSVIDTSTNKPIKRVPVVFQPFGVAVSTDGTKVYVSNTGTTHLSVINTSTDNVTATIPVGFLPQDIAFTRDGTKAYVPNFRHSVSVIDTSTDRALTPIQVGTNPQGVAVSPDGTKVYVTNGIDNTISVIDTANTILQLLM
jgi:YVTN family beta-propeller protein